MGKAGKARKAGKAQARQSAATNKNERQRASTQKRAKAMILTSAVATLASPDVPKLGRPADVASVYALGMVRRA